VVEQQVLCHETDQVLDHDGHPSGKRVLLQKIPDGSDHVFRELKKILIEIRGEDEVRLANKVRVFLAHVMTFFAKVLLFAGSLARAHHIRQGLRTQRKLLLEFESEDSPVIARIQIRILAFYPLNRFNPFSVLITLNRVLQLLYIEFN